MTTFDSRERAFEDKFAHDDKLMFKARARRNKLFGLWAAGEMGIVGDAADDYAGAVVVADLEEDGDADVIRKVKADFDTADIEMSEHRLEKHLAEEFIRAKDQVMNEV